MNVNKLSLGDYKLDIYNHLVLTLCRQHTEPFLWDSLYFRLPERPAEELEGEHPEEVGEGALQPPREHARGLADLHRQQHQASRAGQ